MIDKRLILRCKKGESKAQQQLYQLIKNQFMGICLRYAKSKPEAEDVFQEAMIKVFNNLDKLKDHRMFNAWSRRIVVNQAIDSYKKSEKAFMLSIEEQEAHFLDRDANMLEKMEAEEIIALIDQLPEHQRLVFNMYVIDGYSHKEISDQLNVVESSSRTLLTRAKRSLSDSLFKIQQNERGYGS